MNYVEYNGGVVSPSKVVCIGRNFVEHIKELDNEVPKEMVIFNKPNSSISRDLYFVSEDNHYEAELSFLVEGDEICAVGFGLDLTKRELQAKLKEKGLPWERAKAFDKSAVFGKFVKFDDMESLGIELYINGVLVQKGGVDLMINKPKQILKEIKTFMTLEDFDIIMSGTPKGVGKYLKGDKFIGKILQKDKIILEETWIAK